MICGTGGHSWSLLKSAAGATVQVSYFTAPIFLSASGRNILGNQKSSIRNNSLHDFVLMKLTSLASWVQVVS